MDKLKKDLKTVSLVVLVLAALDLIQNIIVGINVEKFSEELSGGGKTFAVVFAVIMISLVIGWNILIGLLGLRAATNDEVTGKAHIVLAFIALVFCVFSLVSAFKGITPDRPVFDTILDIAVPVLNAAIMLEFVIVSRKLRKLRLKSNEN